MLLALAGQARGAELGPGECVGDGHALEIKVGVELAPVCVGAGGSTVLEFESAIVGERTVVEGGDVEPFTGVGGTKLMVDGAAGAALGVARRVTVYFGDGFEPASATFPLVVVADSTKRVVKVLRQPRTAASLREEVEDLTRRLEACLGGGGQAPTVSAPAGLLPGSLALSGDDAAALRWRVVGEALARVRIRTPVAVAAEGFGVVDVVSEPTRRAVPGKYTLKLRDRGASSSWKTSR